MDLKCQKCGRNLGYVDKGKLHNKIIFLCGVCWGKASAAMNVAESVSQQVPDFLKDLMGGKFK